MTLYTQDILVICTYFLIGAIFAAVNMWWSPYKPDYITFILLLVCWPIVYAIEFYMRTFYEIGDDDE